MSNKFKDFGIKLQQLRDKKGESVTAASKAIGIDRTHLSKLENGHERPSFEALNSIISHYSLSGVEALELSALAGYKGEGLMAHEEGSEEVKSMQQQNVPDTGSPLPPGGVQINMSVDKTPVLYTDGVYLTTGQYGVVFDFAQNMGPTNQQTIVSRIGMSKEHAKALLRVLAEKLSNEAKVELKKN